MKISNLFDLYIKDFLYFRQSSNSNIEHYATYKKRFIQFVGNIEVDDITLELIREWANWLAVERCQNTIRSYIGGLKQVLKYGSIRGIKCLDAALINIPKRIPVTVSYVTPEEVTIMIEKAQSKRNKLIVSMLYSSGVRLSELLSLNTNSIHDRQFTVIGKGKKERLCFIDARTETLIKEYLATRKDACDALFVSEQFHKRVSASTIQLIIRNLAKQSGLGGKHITPHSFRHGHATNLIKNGADIRYVAQDLGHANVSTTMIYTHIENPDLREKYEKYHTI